MSDCIAEMCRENTRLRAELAAERDRNGIITQAAQEVTNALRAENEKLRNAGERIVEWWLADGVKHYNGAPSAMFALRRALGHIKE